MKVAQHLQIEQVVHQRAIPSDIENEATLYYSESKTQKNIALNKNIEKIFKSRKIWCAASTHNGEEKICAEAHQKLKKKYKKLLTVIIPRHVHRVNNIYKEVNDMPL